MKRLNSPSFVYTRSTTASRRAAQQAQPVRGHISVAFMPNPAHTGEVGDSTPPYIVDGLNSDGTLRR